MRTQRLLPILAALACSAEESGASGDFPDPDVVQLPEGDGRGEHLDGEYQLDMTVVECMGDCVGEMGAGGSGGGGGGGEPTAYCSVGASFEKPVVVDHDAGRLEIDLDNFPHEGGVNRDGTFDVVEANDILYEEFHQRLRGTIGSDGVIEAFASKHVVDAEYYSADPIDCYIYSEVSGMKEL